jgi:hypothetical protein
VAVSPICHGCSLIRGSCRTAHPRLAVLVDEAVSLMCRIMIHSRPAGIVIGGPKATSRVIFGVGTQPVPLPNLLGRGLLRLSASYSRLAVLRGILTVVGNTRMGRRGIASAVGNTTAVETDNATFWSADGTSEDGAAGSVPGSRWRWGHLRQVGERALCGRNRRWCRYAAWRRVAGATTAADRQDKQGSTAAQRNRVPAFMIRHSMNRHRLVATHHCLGRHDVRLQVSYCDNAPFRCRRHPDTFVGNVFQFGVRSMREIVTAC